MKKRAGFGLGLRERKKDNCSCKKEKREKVLKKKKKERNGDWVSEGEIVVGVEEVLFIKGSSASISSPPKGTDD